MSDQNQSVVHVMAGGGQPQSVREVQPGEIPPGRVQVAMEFIHMMSQKERQTAAVSDSSIQVIDGTPLTTAESNARATACNLLNDYFLGKVKPTYWERQPRGRTYVDQRDVCECEECMPQAMSREPLPSSYVTCWVCSQNGSSPDCVICCGTGHLFVTPVRREGGQ